MTAHSVADRLRQIDRAVTILTRSTGALLRATEERALLDDICRIAVDVAGYRLAWVGYAGTGPDKAVIPAAAAGPGEKYVREINVSWADTELGQGPIGTAIRSGVPQVVRDTGTDSHFAPWSEAARRHRLRSAIALPLGQGDDRLGALNIYAGEPDAFDADIPRLLEDLARNLTYGIGALRMKAGHERAVRDLAESEERYRSLIDLAPDAIIVHSQGTVLFANPASRQVFGGAEGGSLVGTSVLDLVADSVPEIAAERVIAGHRLKRLDGNAFDAEVAASTITFDGLPARILVIRDVTDRKQAQEQAIQAAKLATLGEMAAGLVHELSQPLNVIRLSAEGALMFIERGKATAEWQAQQFQLVAEQARRTAEIIDDIRIFARRDTSPVQVFDAVSAIRSAMGVLENQLRTDGIALVTDLPADTQLVRGRRVQLEQVVMNLLSNARHALKERRDQQGLGQDDLGQDGGWKAGVAVSAGRNGGNLVIKVTDTGPGIPPKIRARIFEPFVTTREAGRGTGLGLSVSFGIIAAMGGRLETLDLPVGACFAITLPIDETAIPGASEGHIMVVDDERSSAAPLGDYLREMGWRVTLCTSGREAYDHFMADPADVVITDLRMPAGNGEQLVERLRDYDPLQPIVIVTGHLGATERLADYLQDDRCAVFEKPVALAKLGEIVATLLQPPKD